MKKFSILLIALILLTSSLIGCKPVQAPAETAAPTAAPQSEAPAPSDTPAPTVTPAANIDALPFSAEDFVLGGLTKDSTGEDAKKLFGEPTEVFKSEAQASGDLLETWSYDFGELIFINENSKLIFIGGSIIDGSIAGPRGIKIGDEFEKVKNLFPHDGANNVLYSANMGDTSDIILPPRGYYDSEERVLYYDAPVQPYGDAVKKEMQSYVYEAHYSSAFEFDEDTNTLTRITLNLGAFAE